MIRDNDEFSADILLDVLKKHPEGISEHALLSCLQNQKYIHIEPDGFHDMMKLFRVHFMLFHRLYRLRDQLHADGVASLNIHALCIRLMPYSSYCDTCADNAVATEDPLRLYYLNLDHLTYTDQAELDALLNGFWISYRQGTFDGGRDGVRDEIRHDALTLLNLDDQASDQEIKQAWRRLVMQHHPDRGGDEEQIKSLNQAVSVLLAR